MAKMNANPNFGAKMAAARAAKAAQAPIIANSQAPIEAPVNEETIVAPTAPMIISPEPVKTQTTDPDLSLKSILAKMEAMSKEITDLKAGKEENQFSRMKEKYKGPRHYKFSLRGGVPVLSWKSFRKDLTKDLIYQNENKMYISNHYLKLQLQDGSTADVEVNTYNRDKQKTEPLACSVTTNEEGETIYVFNTPDYGKVSILSPYIN